MNISLFTPAKLVFGTNSRSVFAEDIIASGYKRLFVLCIDEVMHLMEKEISDIRKAGCHVMLNKDIRQEPSFSDYAKVLEEVNAYDPECVAGIGGGSILDTAKLLAATAGNNTDLEAVLLGREKLGRKKKLICLPTTAGTGSEVSPNAIFFDTESGAKTGVIDPQLVPDATYIDPILTVGLPPSVTAATGLDALTHCIEAYANKFSNPHNDMLALEGIRLIGRNLKRACLNGEDLEAREKVALGSMYGGMCLGPVNTGAVHALAYPLGSTFKMAHGISNAVLLPYVLEFNLDFAVEKYAEVARAMGIVSEAGGRELAQEGIKFIRKLIEECQIPGRLSDYNIEEKHIEDMAISALKIQRLLKNNVREVSLQDAITIYRKAL